MAVLDWDERSPVSVPETRQLHALEYDAARENIVLFGGVSSTLPVKPITTYTWNGADWTLETPATQPTGRAGPGMAYDSVREVVVLFGGNTDGDETWEWDGAEWAQLSPATVMDVRFNHGQAYDPVNEKVVLFGGNLGLAGGPAEDDETWTFDGTDWTQEAPGTVPAARQIPGMIWDGARILMFGGVGVGVNVWLNDTWVWDGSDWTELFPATPPSDRSGFGMAYESGCGGNVILFGGNVSSAVPGTEDDTWHFDGSEWVELVPATTPPRRANTRLAYDEAHGEIIMFGGTTGSGSLLADTWGYRTCEPLAGVFMPATSIPIE